MKKYLSILILILSISQSFAQVSENVPEIIWISPTEDSLVTNVTEIEIKISIKSTSTINSLKLLHNNILLTDSLLHGYIVVPTKYNTISKTIVLNKERNEFFVTAKNNAGLSNSRRCIYYRNNKPNISIINSAKEVTTSKFAFEALIKSKEELQNIEIYVNNKLFKNEKKSEIAKFGYKVVSVETVNDVKVKQNLFLEQGTNIILLKAKNYHGITIEQYKVVYKKTDKIKRF